LKERASYSDFFRSITGFSAWPYQARLGTEPWPTLLDIPTGLGKTAAVVVAWLYRRLEGCPDTPRRLVYCLPMRSLVTQTAQAARRWVEASLPLWEAAGLEAPGVDVLMGGQQELSWAAHPERPHILVGTQDMLLSRALMRGYGMSRYAWPIHFAWLHNDAFWVFDETQLMGVGVETGAQLEGLRQELGTAAGSRSLWMSATLAGDQLQTVDHPRPAQGWPTLTLGQADRDLAGAAQRLRARKALERAPLTLSKATRKKYPRELAALVLQRHQPGSLTLVVLNRVQRAQEVYKALLDLGRDPQKTALLHSRYRRQDRARREDFLEASGDRIVVSTQVIEAGVDISARVLISELAPWASMIQRAGRCNRYGERDDAQFIWLDIAGDKGDLLPYEEEPLGQARDLLRGLEDMNLSTLRALPWEPAPEVRPVLRRRDLLELFDTSPELSGEDLDVSRFVRDGQDTDALVYWRDLPQGPDAHTAAPERHELCRVPVSQLRAFLKGHRSKTPVAWRHDALADRWVQASPDTTSPGCTVLMHTAAGGYSDDLGWTGGKERPSPSTPQQRGLDASMGSDPDSYAPSGWLTLSAHLADVTAALDGLGLALGLEGMERDILRTSALWHDVGKAHPAFQEALVGPGREDPALAPPRAGQLWAKSNHRSGRPGRRYFRHELASALALMQQPRGAATGHLDGLALDLAVYLVAAHHGKIRLTLRALPEEQRPEDPTRRFARGVHEGDLLPAVTLPELGAVGPWTLDLAVMELGPGSWSQKCQQLCHHGLIGPMRLAWWESLLRIADHRGSAHPSTEEEK
jgi:CRISPR-associated endonuclease/helicase Cas3